MNTNIYEYLDYRDYLNFKIREKSGRGERTRLARALGCHSAYLSRVLSGQAHLSLEQADSLNEYFEHTEEESEYFLLLVCWDRSGKSSLKARFKKRIDQFLESRSLLKNRLEVKNVPPLVEQGKYYSAWFYTALHLLLRIEIYKKSSISQLANVLQIPPHSVQEVLSFLERNGLVEKNREGFYVSPVSLHLPSDSTIILQHHTNWRTQSILSLPFTSKDELHYSSVITMAKKDLPRAREVLVDAIEKVRAIVKESTPDEGLYCYNLDLFKIVRD